MHFGVSGGKEKRCQVPFAWMRICTKKRGELTPPPFLLKKIQLYNLFEDSVKKSNNKSG